MRVDSLHDWPVTAPELRLCVRLNRCAAQPSVRHFFAAISRLGDGVIWYSLMCALPLLDGLAGLRASLHLALVGLVALLLYRTLKRYTRRPRPFARHGAITAYIAPLDEFSFPSGHTLHAVAFTLVAMTHYPLLGIVLVPFAALIAASRCVLGVHYPSDVLAATLIGAALAHSSNLLIA